MSWGKPVRGRMEILAGSQIDSVVPDEAAIRSLCAKAFIQSAHVDKELIRVPETNVDQYAVAILMAKNGNIIRLRIKEQEKAPEVVGK